MRFGRAVAEVARWEFRRYVKPKQQIVGMLVTFVIFGGFMMFGRVAGRDEGGVKRVAVIGSDNLPLAAAPLPALSFTPHDAGAEAELRRQVSERDLDGLLIIRDADHAELVLRRQAAWTDQVHAVLGAARQQRMIERSGVSPEQLATIMQPPELTLTYPERGGDTRAERLATVVLLSIMLMAVFIGMSYIFASITGEKQIRVTEQVVSAIPAQAWIDGKILGLIAVSVVGVIAQIIAFAAVFLLMRALFDTPPLPLPDSLGSPAVIALVTLYAVLGLFFWFAFLGAVAATIDDPHSSTRGSLLFVPMFASGLAFMVIGDPASGMSRFYSLFPPTAPSAMPARLLLSDVGGAEVVISLALLIGAILLLRVAAGRIFRVAMLMYGKEPTWSELRRWALDTERR